MEVVYSCWTGRASWGLAARRRYTGALGAELPFFYYLRQLATLVRYRARVLSHPVRNVQLFMFSKRALELVLHSSVVSFTPKFSLFRRIFWEFCQIFLSKLKCRIRKVIRKHRIAYQRDAKEYFSVTSLLKKVIKVKREVRKAKKEQLIEENQFYEEAEGMLYGPGIAD